MDYLVGIVVGLVLGLTGAGGSVFAVPLLIYLVQVSPQQAIGTSLGVVFISSLFGVFTRLKSQQIAWLPAIVYSAVASLFAPLGVYLNKQTSQTLLMSGFSILVFIVAIRLWQQAVKTPQDTATVRSSLPEISHSETALCRINSNAPFKIGLPCLAGVSFGAVTTGILSGLFGVGGGFLIVPTLLFLTGIGIQQAVATSLVVISVVSLSGFISFIVSGSVIEQHILTHVATGGLIGMLIGTLISRYLAGPVLQKLFAVLMLLMAVITLFTSVR